MMRALRRAAYVANPTLAGALRRRNIALIMEERAMRERLAHIRELLQQEQAETAPEAGIRIEEARECIMISGHVTIERLILASREAMPSQESVFES